jgi:regulator of protease activity HflC (stomatin/prohibitin superfamily)
MAVSSKRAEKVAWFALLMSVIFFVVTLVVSIWSGYLAIYATAWLGLSAVLIWFILLIQFQLRRLAEQEKLDMSQLAKQAESTTIFQGSPGKADLFAVAQKRLAIFEKWFVPGFSAVIAIYQVLIGLYLVNKVLLPGSSLGTKPLYCSAYIIVIAFMSFLTSRFATGMSAEQKWKPLRAGGSILLALALSSLALAIALGFAHYKINIVVQIVSWVITILILLLGVETGLNTILDIYRPRLKGQYSRSAFDSRLLGVINEPGGIFHSLAGAIDYQFGFKVSQTWFYKLLEKAVVPLVLFAAAVLYLMSGIVVLDPNEIGIVEHFGNPVSGSGQIRYVGPGLHLKWPWPIDKVKKFPTELVREIQIGYVPKVYKENEKRQPLLWGKEHYEQEDNLLVATEQVIGDSETGTVPVSLIVAAVPVQYKVKDVHAFLYNYGVTEEFDGTTVYHAEEMLKAISYSELTRLAAAAKVDIENDEDIETNLFGAGRIQAGKTLTERIQAAADEAQLGIEIVFVGMQGVHPPLKVATDYQKVIGSVQEKQTLILNAQIERSAILNQLAGTIDDAQKLSWLAAEYRKAQERSDTEAISELAPKLDAARHSGRPRATLSRNPFLHRPPANALPASLRHIVPLRNST